MYKMLIVEDERWEREGLMEFLDWSSYGIQICGTACDGVDGFDMAVNLKPHIIITDIQMKIMNGLEMSKKIKAVMPEVHIIILTGYDNFKYAKEAIGFGAFNYLLKPVDEEECIEVIQEVVKKCKKEEDELGKLARQRTLIQDHSERIVEVYKEDVEALRNDKETYLIEKIKKLVEEKYMNNISLKTIANEVFLSPNYLGYLFKKSVGKQFNEYLLEYQMNKAKELLILPNHKVAKIAQDVGIPNASYFCVVFKKKYGISPREFQELMSRKIEKEV